jgi:hypothetical protein
MSEEIVSEVHAEARKVLTRRIGHMARRKGEIDGDAVPTSVTTVDGKNQNAGSSRWAGDEW